MGFNGCWGRIKKLDAADRRRLQPFDPSQLVFEVLEDEGDVLTIQSGERVFKVVRSSVVAIATPPFSMKDRVRVISQERRVGTICTAVWHHKQSRPFFVIRFEGRRSDRRYEAHELERAPIP